MKILVTEHADHFTQLDFIREVLILGADLEIVFRVGPTQGYWVKLLHPDPSVLALSSKNRVWREFRFYSRVLLEGFRSDFIIVNTGPENESFKLILLALFVYLPHKSKLIYTVRNPIKYSKIFVGKRRLSFARGLFVTLSPRLMFESEKVRTEVYSNFPSTRNKPSTVAYGRLPAKRLIAESTECKSNFFTLGLLGTVTSQRRDYGSLIEALRLVDPKLRQGLRICFLGGTDAKDSNHWIETFKSEFEVLENPQKWLSREDFLELGLKCDALLSPLNLESKLYGSGQSTASFGDAIALGKALIIPMAADQQGEFSSFCFYYSSVPQLADCLARLMEDDSLRLLDSGMFEMYSREKQFENWFAGVLAKHRG
jgi:hypothetical protein